MDKKNREGLDKYLQKFAIKGQEKLVGQLRQMLNPKQDKKVTKNGEMDKSSSNKLIGRKSLFELMNSLQNEIENNNQPKEKSKHLWFEFICKPNYYPDNVDIAQIIKTLQTISVENENKYFTLNPPDNKTTKLEINKTQFDCIKDQSKKNDGLGFWFFIPENGVFYTRNITTESKQNSPNVFDPKIQSLTIAETLISLGQLYQSFGLNYRDKLDIAFRYSNAVDLAVGSISTETFLPTTKYKEEALTFYIARELHEIKGQTAETAAEIVIELLKKLHYQGIVNKDFFTHAISKHLVQK